MKLSDISPNDLGDWLIIAVILIQIFVFGISALFHSEIAFGYANAAIIGAFWYFTEVIVHGN